MNSILNGHCCCQCEVPCPPHQCFVCAVCCTSQRPAHQRAPDQHHGDHQRGAQPTAPLPEHPLLLLRVRASPRRLLHLQSLRLRHRPRGKGAVVVEDLIQKLVGWRILIVKDSGIIVYDIVCCYRLSLCTRVLPQSLIVYVCVATDCHCVRVCYHRASLCTCVLLQTVIAYGCVATGHQCVRVCCF